MDSKKNDKLSLAEWQDNKAHKHVRFYNDFGLGIVPVFYENFKEVLDEGDQDVEHLIKTEASNSFLNQEMAILDMEYKKLYKSFTVLHETHGDLLNMIKWHSSEYPPACYETGNFDGERSHYVIAQTEDGRNHIARFYSGFMDGSKFEEWADNRDDSINAKVVKWKEIN